MKRLNKRTRKGFTIVEVTIVTAFVAMLLIAITVIITQIASIYQKGLTLKAINSVGRNLVTEFTTAINSAPSIDSTSLCTTLIHNNAARNICMDNGAFKFIYQSYGGVRHDLVTNTDGNVQYAGVFCTGDYSYVWNTYYGIESNQTVRILYNQTTNPDHSGVTYASDPSKPNEPFKLVRFKDVTYRACSNNVSSTYNDDNLEDYRTIDIRKLANGTAWQNSQTSFQEGFLDASNIFLSLYELTIFPVSQDWVTLRTFFSGTFILATDRGDVNITRTGDYCDVTNQNGVGDGSSNLLDLGSNFNYCGINKFNFAARTAGSGV